ncbi:MAG: hypothetical protein HQL68_11610 [Magnetococcales bacterium]|nr:hypothetical protein [Magnetococcales bacterium]
MSENIQLIPSPRFEKSFKKLSRMHKDRTRKALKAFITNPSSTGLNFEKVVNRPGLYSIRADLKCRIFLRKITDGIFTIVNVGGHNLYQKR